MNLLREYIRELLNEDPMGFVRQLSKSKNYPEEFFGGTIPKEAGKDIKRAEKAPTKTAQKRDVKLSKPAVGTKKPVAKPAAKPAAAKAGRAAKPSGGKAGAFNKSQKGGQARASSNRGAKSRGGGGGRKGGGRRG